MSGKNYYLLSLLPSLGDLGSAPPMSISELVSQVGDVGGGAALINALALGDDLLQRESYMAGEVENLELSILTEDQGRGEAELPGELLEDSQDETDSVKLVDSVWAGYFRYVMRVAEQAGNNFLKAWVGREVTLRNGLAEARAKNLGLDVERYLVAEELADTEIDLGGVVNEWSAAATPLAGLQVIERSGWAWLMEHENWFSFGNDELAVYAAKLLALSRWRRVAEGQKVEAGAKVVNENEQ